MAENNYLSYLKRTKMDKDIRWFIKTTSRVVGS